MFNVYRIIDRDHYVILASGAMFKRVDRKLEASVNTLEMAMSMEPPEGEGYLIMEEDDPVT